MIFCHPVYSNYEPDVKSADPVPVRFTKLFSKLRACVHEENKGNVVEMFLSLTCCMDHTHLLCFQTLIAKFLAAEHCYTVG